MATHRTVYHVLPDSAPDQWVVIQENDARLRDRYRTKADAVAAARQRAEGHEPSQLKVHTSDGSIEYESTYGGGPVRVPG
jgi:hypothetical protein